jgi:hypothetical protein
VSDISKIVGPWNFGQWLIQWARSMFLIGLRLDIKSCHYKKLYVKYKVEWRKLYTKCKNLYTK